MVEEFKPLYRQLAEEEIKATKMAEANNAATTTEVVPDAKSAMDAKPAEASAPARSFDDAYVTKLRKDFAETEQRAKELQRQFDERQKKELEEQGEFRKIADAAEKRALAAEHRAEEIKAQANERYKMAELKSLAVTLGITDPDVVKLADLSGVSVDDSGALVGGREAIEAFKASKPHFFREAKAEPQLTTRGRPIPPAPSTERPTTPDARKLDDKTFDELWKGYARTIST
jgi:hypothetical protein